MADRLESLMRRCRRRKLKRWVKRVSVAVLLGVVAGVGIFYYQKSRYAIPQTDRTALRQTLLPKGEVSKPSSGKISQAPVRPVSRKKPELSTASTQEAARTAEEVELIALAEATKEPKPKGRFSGKKVADKSSAKPASGTSENKVAVMASKPPKKRVVPPLSSSIVAQKMPEKPVPKLLKVKEVTDIDALVRQYEKYPRYATALKIARLWYERKAYEKASLWARKANALDRDDERAWILYAKSEYARGRRERAVRILRLYLDYRESPRARSLLLNWSKE